MPTIKIKGMSCRHCVKSVTEALKKIDGVSDVNVNLEKGEASYEGDVDIKTMKKTIAEIGFEVLI